MPAAMPCSRWSGLPARMIWMRLICCRQQRRKAKLAVRSEIKKTGLNGGQGNAKVQQASASHRTNAGLTSPQSTLEPEASTALRDQLIADIKDISSAEEAASWAHRVMGAKNSLAVADAEQVERAFQERLLSVTSETTASSLPLSWRPSGKKRRRRRSVVDKTVLTLPA